jgi:type II secretion system (T2SS) protein F
MSLLLLAGALLVAPSSSPGRARLLRLRRSVDSTPGAPVSTGRRVLPALSGAAVALLAAALGGIAGAVVGVGLGVGVAVGCRRVLARDTAPPPDPLRLAGGWDLLAACLRSGLPVPVAVRAVAQHMPSPAAAELATIADRLALGADPHAAWEIPESSPVHKLARAARRSAHSGASLATVAQSVAAEVRAGALDLVAARGQRAGVLITGPLGLCFLPAFLALGVVPVVIGLASGLAVAW